MSSGRGRSPFDTGPSDQRPDVDRPETSAAPLDGTLGLRADEGDRHPILIGLRPDVAARYIPPLETVTMCGRLSAQ
jgi:hypothetical protein